MPNQIITAAQLATLDALIANNDRVGFYVKLNEYTGSKTALLMSSISSSSGIIGGAAWNINRAYELVMPTYPVEGVEKFSQDIALADLNSIKALGSNEAGEYFVPSDNDMLLAAYNVWAANHSGFLFPGNVLIAANYIAEGKFKEAAEFSAYAAMTSAWTISLGLGDMVWEIFDYRGNSGKSIQEFLDNNPGSTAALSANGATQIVTDANGKTIGSFPVNLLDAIPVNFVQGLRQSVTDMANVWLELGGLRLGRGTGSIGIDLAVNSLATAALNWVPPRRDPLVLDLDGNGITTSGINPAAPILFDQDGDGIKNATGWIASGEAIVVRDLNGNGTIDSGREIFGDNTILTNGPKAGQTAANGFEALADLDSNHYLFAIAYSANDVDFKLRA